MTTTSLTREDVAELLALLEKATPGPWKVCGDGKCSYKVVWSSDFPIAQVTHGPWGDDYPSLRLVGSSLDRKVEAYMEQITYGEIPEQVACANARLISALYNTAPALLALASQSLDREAEIRRAAIEECREMILEQWKVCGWENGRTVLTTAIANLDALAQQPAKEPR